MFREMRVAEHGLVPCFVARSSRKPVSTFRDRALVSFRFRSSPQPYIGDIANFETTTLEQIAFKPNHSIRLSSRKPRSAAIRDPQRLWLRGSRLSPRSRRGSARMTIRLFDSDRTQIALVSWFRSSLYHRYRAEAKFETETTP